MIVGDLRAGVAHHGQQGGFTHVGESHQAHIRDHLQLQFHPQLLAGLTRLGIFRRLHGRSGIMHIAQAALAAF